MPCKCSGLSFMEQYFGRQIYNSGTLDRIDRLAIVDPVYTPTNALGFNYELGFNGYRYGTAMPNTNPQYFQPGYGGVLPLAQQPKIDMPFPYDERVVV